MNKEEIKDYVLSEYKKGNIVFQGFDGLYVGPMNTFIKTSAYSMLYDINRGPESILADIDDPKWINDYAAAKIIIELKKQLDKANAEI